VADVMTRHTQRANCYRFSEAVQKSHNTYIRKRWHAGTPFPLIAPTARLQLSVRRVDSQQNTASSDFNIGTKCNSLTQQLLC